MDMPSFAPPTGRNTPGVGNRFLAAERNWFLALQSPVSPTVAFGDQATIATDHTFQTGKGFREFYTTLGEAELKAKRVGARDSRGFMVDFDFFTPGNDPALAQWFSEDKEFIFMIQDADCTTDTYYMMGSKCLSAFIEEGEWGSGKALAADSRKGWTGKLQAYMSALTTYTGAVTLYP